mgnify:CR=1 FL=1
MLTSVLASCNYGNIWYDKRKGKVILWPEKRTYKILLSDEDKKILNATIHNKKTCKMTIQRCQILLELDENAPKHLTQMQIAKTFGVSKATVSNIVSAYANAVFLQFIKINRNPRSNARRKMDGRMEAELLRITCSPAPDVVSVGHCAF